jgi:hypothetical protein
MPGSHHGQSVRLAAGRAPRGEACVPERRCSCCEVEYLGLGMTEVRPWYTQHALPRGYVISLRV